MINTFQEVLDYWTDLKYNVIVNDWKCNTDTLGLQFERIAKQKLKELGFELGKAESCNILLNDFIELHGKPDGIILSSPGDFYKSGTLIEIKHKRDNNNNKSFYQQDLSQMAAYSMIFNRDILYVKVYNDEHIECELYTVEYLQTHFNKRANYIFDNCAKIRDLIMQDDENSRRELIQLSKHKPVKSI